MHEHPQEKYRFSRSTGIRTERVEILVSDKNNYDFLVVGFLGRLENSAGF